TPVRPSPSPARPRRPPHCCSATSEWRQIQATGDVPSGRGAPTLVVYEKSPTTPVKYVLFGGGMWRTYRNDMPTDITYYNGTYILDSATWRWTLVQTRGGPPGARA